MFSGLLIWVLLHCLNKKRYADSPAVKKCLLYQRYESEKAKTHNPKESVYTNLGSSIPQHQSNMIPIKTRIQFNRHIWACTDLPKALKRDSIYNIMFVLEKRVSGIYLNLL